MDDQVIDLLTRVLAGLATALSAVFGWLMRVNGQRVKDKEEEIEHARESHKYHAEEIRREHDHQSESMKAMYEERLVRHKEIIAEKEAQILLLQERIETVYIEFLKKLNGRPRHQLSGGTDNDAKADGVSDTQRD